MKYFKYVLFLLMVLAQWFIPLKMLNDQKKIKTEGIEFHFLTRPIDPIDPLRGKYINLEFVLNQFEADYINESFEGRAFAEIVKDDEGFASIKKISKEALHEKNVIEIFINNVNKKVAYFELPFNKYFLNENIAQDAEDNYEKLRTNRKIKCYAKVFINNGGHALTDVFVEDRSLIELTKNIKSGKFTRLKGILSLDQSAYKFINCLDNEAITLLDNKKHLYYLFNDSATFGQSDELYSEVLIDKANNKLIYIIKAEKLDEKNNCLDQ